MMKASSAAEAAEAAENDSALHRTQDPSKALSNTENADGKKAYS